MSLRLSVELKPGSCQSAVAVLLCKIPLPKQPQQQEEQEERGEQQGFGDGESSVTATRPTPRRGASSRDGTIWPKGGWGDVDLTRNSKTFGAIAWVTERLQVMQVMLARVARVVRVKLLCERVSVIESVHFVD